MNPPQYDANNKLHPILRNSLISSASAFSTAVPQFPSLQRLLSVRGSEPLLPAKGFPSARLLPFYSPSSISTSASQLSLPGFHPHRLDTSARPPPLLLTDGSDQRQKMKGISWEVIPCTSLLKQRLCARAHSTAREKCMRAGTVQYCTLCFVH